jgi:hypothetical protein
MNYRDINETAVYTRLKTIYILSNNNGTVCTLLKSSSKRKLIKRLMVLSRYIRVIMYRLRNDRNEVCYVEGEGYR